MEDSNIKVICRFRPLNESENNKGSVLCVEFLSDTSLRIPNDSETSQYTFDQAFQPTCTQQQVYQAAARPIVESVMQGFNGTVFAYGQTSSGKTFTMMGGGPKDPISKGIIPRMVETVFSTIQKSVQSIQYELKISYCEIYMEKIKDLIDPKKTNLKIHEDKARGIYIDGLSECGIGSEEEVYDLMTLGSNNREVAYTNMNAGSSRSHSLFIISIAQTNSQDLSTKIGKLFLVDLAGSEKVGKTGAAGMRLEEAKNINKSLTVLGLVINNLTDGKSSHIPYRDSKLTRVLQDSLGGNSKTALIVTCSPSPFNEAETVSTLRFGMRAKAIKNKPKVNREFTVPELKLLLAKAQEEIEAKNRIILKLRDGVKPEALGEIMKEIGDSEQKSNEGMVEVMEEIEEYKERLTELSGRIEKLNSDNEKLRIEVKILESENSEFRNNNQKIQGNIRLWQEKAELLKDSYKDQESLIEKLVLTKETLEKNLEQQLKTLLETQQEVRNKSSEISKLKSELLAIDQPVFNKRQVSMSFSPLGKLVPSDTEEIDGLYKRIENYEKTIQELELANMDLLRNSSQDISKKNEEISTQKLENTHLHQEKMKLLDRLREVEKSYNEAVRSSNVSTNDLIKQNEEYFLQKLEYERNKWHNEKSEIMKDLENRITRVLELEILIDSQKDSINNAQRRLSVQDKDLFRQTVDLQNNFQDLSFKFMKEKNAFEVKKIELDILQKKLNESNQENKVLKDEVQSLTDKIGVFQENLRMSQHIINVDEDYNPRKAFVPFNIKKTIAGGQSQVNPYRQSIIIQKNLG